MKTLIASFALAATLLAPTSAMARAKLVAASPAAETTVSKPTKLTLKFSEDVQPSLSGVELTMTGMPGMAHHNPMAIKGFTTKVAGQTVTVNLPRALPAGTYLLKWFAAGADKSRVEGKYAFTVK